jgi:hypothetical protein
MFIRYVVAGRDEDSHRLLGVFHAAHRARHQGLFDEEESRQYEGLRRWFATHLPVPARFSRSRRPHAPGNAVCWLKADAAEHADKLRALAAMLERHGFVTQMLWTRRPGYLVYEDDYQVAAVPFRDTPG